MSWYYADNTERRGPIDDAAFQSLIASGAIKPETLVWQEGMANWIPYAQVPARPGSPPASSEPPAPGSVQCSTCGGYFPPGDVIAIAGRNICAACKPRALQHMVEGTDGGGASIDPAKLLADLRARGGYKINPGDLLGRAWTLVKGNLGPCIGTTLLAYFIIMVASNIPCVGIIAPFLVTGPIFGGLFLYFLKQLRGQPATINDSFAGFSKPHFGQLALVGTVQTLVTMVVMAIFLVPGFALSWSGMQSNPNDIPVPIIVCGLLAIVPVMYFSTCWFFSYAFVIDKRLRFWDAMELSRKIVNMNLLGWLLLMIVITLLSLAGVLALCVGIIFVLPVTFCAFMVLYEDLVTGKAAPNT